MSETTTLRRKLGASRAEVPPPHSPGRAWRRAVMHGISRGLGLDVAAGAAECGPCMPEDAAGLMEVGTLSVLLDSPAGYGVALIDPGAVSGLIEWQTLGRLRANPPPPRPATETDAAMVADCLDRILSAQQSMVELTPAPHPPSGFRFATRLAEPREVALHLADGVHDHWRIDLHLGPGGQRAGRLHFILPREVSVDRIEPDRTWGPRMESLVLGTEVRLVAELARLTLSAEKLRELTVGQKLTLPVRAISTVRIVGPSGIVIGKGRLGQSAGRKALRIEAPPDEAFVAARHAEGEA